MNLFEVILFNIILILCPLLSYLLYLFFQKTLDKDKNSLFLDCALFSAFYLLIKFGITEYHGVPLIFFDILLLIAYLNNKKLDATILSIVLVLYFYRTFEINFIFLIIEYIIYFIIYLFRKKFKKISYISFIILVKMFISYNYVYFSSIITYDTIHSNIDFIVLVLIFYLVAKSIIYLFNMATLLCSSYKSFQNIEQDNLATESLFKITHEIKNPIAVIKGYLDMYDTNKVEHSKKYIPIIKGEINRLLILLGDFLSISKIKIEKDEMDLSMLLDDVKNNFNLILKDRNIELKCKDIDDFYICADYNRLKQVLVNIIKNSMESITNNGLIKVSIIKYNKKFKIIIEDNGVGMSKDELKRINEAFFTTKKNGTGLGIYLSNEIIDRHNGTLVYKSKKDVGTKAIITLPIK